MGADGQLLVSLDGSQWGTSNLSGVRDLLYNGSTLVAVGDSGIIDSGPRLPVVKLVNPASNVDVALGTSVLLTATTGAGEAISKVSFYVNGVEVGDVTSSPYTLAFVASSYQDYVVDAVATGASGHTATTESATISVPLPLVERSPGPTASDLNAVAFGNGIYAAAGDSGTVVTSSNGLIFTAVAALTPDNLYGMAYDAGTFVAVGENEDIFTSTDGVHWTSRRSVETAPSLFAAAYGGGKFTAVGSGGDLLTSTDGTTWVSQTSNTTADLHGVGYGNGLVGRGGK